MCGIWTPEWAYMLIEVRHRVIIGVLAYSKYFLCQPQEALV